MIPDIPKKRTVRSFVRRSGRLTPSQKNALDRWWPDYGIDFQSHPIALEHGFEQTIIEIGIGNGDALINMAGNDVNSLYIGVEVHEPGVGRCLNMAHKNDLNNVRLIQHDAIEVLDTMIVAESVDAVYLFFPDPWHKKRHHKRRIVQAEFRDLLDKVLKKGGRFHAATDWQDYAEHIAEEMLSDERFENLGNAEGYAGKPDYRPLTKFEQRGQKLGHGVWDLLFRKK